MKYYRKKISILLILALLISFSDIKREPKVCADTANNASGSSVSSPTPSPETTPKESASETPSAKPSATTTPKKTTAPKSTKTPKPTKKPKKKKVKKPGKIKWVNVTYRDSRKAYITWNKAKRASGYLIYRKKIGAKKFNLIKKRSKKKRYFLDKNVGINKYYMYKVKAYRVKYKKTVYGRGKTRRYSNLNIVSTKFQKYSYNTMVSDIGKLEKKYPGRITHNVIGKSEDGRNIYDVIIGNRYASKSVLFIAAIHAREYMTTLLAMRQIEYSLQQYNYTIGKTSVKNTLSDVCVHYIVMANPDGVMISQNGFSSIRSSKLRKKLYAMGPVNTALWKANARGVDLNRNFAFKFKKSGKMSSAGYTGKKAHTEKETKAIVKLVKNLKKHHGLKGIVNYHAMGSIIFGSVRKNRRYTNATIAMYNTAKNITKYSDAGSYEPDDISDSHGNFREYSIYVQKIPSITLEIGKTACPLVIKEFKDIWKRNKNILIKEAALF